MGTWLARDFPPIVPIRLVPELTDDDVAWLNAQLELCDEPTVHYARELWPPPLPSGRACRKG